jgi:hypothetical protein
MHKRGLLEGASNREKGYLSIESERFRTWLQFATESTHHFNTITDLFVVVGFFRNHWHFKKIVR